jgi:hypothetical protein
VRPARRSLGGGVRIILHGTLFAGDFENIGTDVRSDLRPHP